jgi:HAD superfamily hydrolase (TIGR01509 family)
MRSEKAHGAAAVGLDAAVRACLFDLDDVLTATSAIHAEAWKKTFDTFLRAYDVRSMRHDAPFDVHADYENHVEGRPSAEGIRAFLESRGIRVPEGDADDAPGTETVHGISAAKQWAFLSLLEARGPHVAEGSVRFVRAARQAGLPCAVVTCSADCDAVLAAAGIADLFQATVDGRVIVRRGLLGKPAPDEYLAAAAALGVEPAHTAVFEASLAGVEAARAGGFAEVIGVDRRGGGHGERLRERGADPVLGDLAELLADPARAG